MSSRIRTLLVEDHTLVRAGLRALLSSIDGIEVVAEAADGVETFEMAMAHDPDLIFMDIAMPKSNGIEVTSRIINQTPDVRIIMLSMYANEEYILQALQAGASGYLMKDSGMEELERAISFVMAGQTYLSPAVSQHVADYLRRVQQSHKRVKPQAEVVSAELTPRQLEILRLIADGHSTREIANELTISIKTAEAHRANIMKRLDIYDIAGLTRYAMRIGLIVD